jgi:hypothetical protein
MTFPLGIGVGCFGYGIVQTNCFRRVILKSNVGMQIGGGETPPLRWVSVHTPLGERQLRIYRLSPARFHRDSAASTEEEV